MVRFLHAADLHLGMRVTRFGENACGRIGEARVTALEQLRKKAAELSADFLLIAGDVFDDHSVSRSEANRAFAILEASPGSCPVYIIPGNHDPLAPGGVWDRDPWTREQPHLRVRFLRDCRPVALPDLNVVLFPCPLRQRRSMDDPTEWIRNHPRTEGDRTIRIGLAHGSLRIRPLPDDDHLIHPDAALRSGLDYLALGHWHRRSFHKSADGVERTAYSGTHEPMGFPEASVAASTGWMSYSMDANDDRFRDDGSGVGLFVTIEGAGAAPKIELTETRRLHWLSAHRDLTGHRVGGLISELADGDNLERTILRLTLSGVVDLRDHARIEELRQFVQNRCHVGSSLDVDEVLIEPDAEQLAEVVGEGVLKRVLERLKTESQSPDPAVRSISDHALKLLYRIAWEEQPA